MRNAVALRTEALTPRYGLPRRQPDSFDREEALPSSRPSLGKRFSATAADRGATRHSLSGFGLRCDFAYRPRRRLLRTLRFPLPPRGDPVTVSSRLSRSQHRRELALRAELLNALPFDPRTVLLNINVVGATGFLTLQLSKRSIYGWFVIIEKLIMAHFFQFSTTFAAVCK